MSEFLTNFYCFLFGWLYPHNKPCGEEKRWENLGMSKGKSKEAFLEGGKHKLTKKHRNKRHNLKTRKH